MASLSDQIDRLSRNARAIRTTAIHTAVLPGNRHEGVAAAGPYTSAVLNAHLGNLIRDIDSSELGLFNLATSAASHPRDMDTRDVQTTGVTRAEFPVATPLRKAPSRRDDAAKSLVIEPEIYASAALKYINRYKPIRPLPHAHSQVTTILERLASVRQSIRELNEALQQTRSAERPSLRSLIDNEEERIRDIQSRFAELNSRKQIAADQQKAPQEAKIPAKSAHIHPEPKLNTIPLTPSPHQDHLWNTPAAAARTLHFTNTLLMDEQAELDDTTTLFTSPPYPPHSVESRLVSSEHLGLIYDVSGDLASTLDSAALSATRKPIPPDDGLILDQDERDKSGEYGPGPGGDEETDVVRSPPVTLACTGSATPSHEESVPLTPVSGSSKSSPIQVKVKVNGEVERIVSRIWSTAGEIIMPGHLFDISGSSDNKPPRAKETIAYLQSLSALSPSSESPSTPSVSSASAGMPTVPSSQQILTAYILLTLLASPPHFSMPLNQIKALLSSKAGAGGNISVGQSTTRVLYGCVAKRLVKIKRGGGEQIVKFDV